MEYTVNSASVAHLWAHQLQNSARNAQGNFYFEGKCIYSYGSHFKCASIVTNQQGNSVYLVTTRTYSPTTSEHMSMVKGAIPCSSQIFNTSREISCRNGKLSSKDYSQAAYYIVDNIALIEECINKQKKSRAQDYSEQVEDALLTIARWINFWELDKKHKTTNGVWLMPVLGKLLSHKRIDVKKYWNIEGIPTRKYTNSSREDKSHLQSLLELIVSKSLIQPTAINGFESRVADLFKEYSADPAIWSKFKKRQDKQEETNLRQAEMRERRKAEVQERNRIENEEREQIKRMTPEERIAKWKSGELLSHWINIPSQYDYNAILRIKNKKIETSMGITVRIDEAKRLWALVERFHANATNFHHDLVHDANNHNWSINSYKNDILTAGCHRIAYPEMEGIARQLGLIA